MKSNRLKRIERPGFRARYSAENKLCEFALHFEPFRINGNPERQAHETNHIWGGTSGRHDLKTNLIRLAWENHNWFHRFPADGRVLSLWVKVSKGEFDRDEFRAASGFFIEGWLLKAEPANSFVFPFLEELRRIFP